MADKIAMEALEVPHTERAAFISARFEKLRASARARCGDDQATLKVAMEFIDRLQAFSADALAAMEQSGGRTGHG